MRQKYPRLDIEVDGGLSPDTIEEAAKVCEYNTVTASLFMKLVN